MEESKILSNKILETYQDKEFIEWMIENLDSEQITSLLISCGIKLNTKSAIKIHKGFLKNKLIIKPTRIKLVEKRIIPPFIFIFNQKEQKFQWTRQEIEEYALEDKLSKNELALSLFLQNYREDAMKIYEQHKNTPKNDTYDNQLIFPLKKYLELRSNSPFEINEEETISNKTKYNENNEIKAYDSPLIAEKKSSDKLAFTNNFDTEEVMCEIKKPRELLNVNSPHQINGKDLEDILKDRNILIDNLNIEIMALKTALNSSKMRIDQLKRDN